MGPKPCNSRRLLYKWILLLRLTVKHSCNPFINSKTALITHSHASNASCFFFKKKFFHVHRWARSGHATQFMTQTYFVIANETQKLETCIFRSKSTFQALSMHAMRDVFFFKKKNFLHMCHWHVARRVCGFIPVSISK